MVSDSGVSEVLFSGLFGGRAAFGGRTQMETELQEHQGGVRSHVPAPRVVFVSLTWGLGDVWDT